MQNFHKICRRCGAAFGTIDENDEYCLFCNPKTEEISEQKVVTETTGDNMQKSIKKENPDVFAKDDNGKLQWTLLPFKELEEVTKVMTAGKNKYGRENWKKSTEEDRYRLEDALCRHVIAYVEGERYDTGKGGDGLNHLAHAICEAIFLIRLDNMTKDA